MSKSENTCTIEDRKFIKASREQVFKFLTEGAELARWWPKVAESEPKPGGKLVLTWFGDNKMATRFDRFDPGMTVSYPFYTEHVTFELQPEGEGTQVKVTHRCTQDSAIHVAQSWGSLLANLKSVIETGYDLR